MFRDFDQMRSINKKKFCVLLTYIHTYMYGWRNGSEMQSYK